MWAKSMVDDEFVRYQLIDFARAIKNLVPSHEEDSLLVPLEQVRSNILRAYGNIS
jgi:PKHD-type hydroxylase